MKKEIYFIFVGILIVIAILALVLNKSTPLKENEILIKKYSYVYDYSVSNICSGADEQLTFQYKNTDFLVIARNKTLADTTRQTFPEYCQNYGTLMRLIVSPDGYMDISDINQAIIPRGCKIFQLNDYNPEIIGMNCTSKLKLEVINREKFNSCLADINCTFVHGDDISIAR